MNKKNIAFYSPLKPVGHQVPSGDRLMARLLVNCLERAGYGVDIASNLRAFLRDPDSESDYASLNAHAVEERERLSEAWTQNGAPLLWFCYHPYFKSPDLIGPELCNRFNIPYITVEASYSKRRSRGVWSTTQELVLESVNQAAVNICYTQRDKIGLRHASSTAVLTRLRPFIDTAGFVNGQTMSDQIHQETIQLVTVAMFRAGDKINSYQRLAAALKRLLHLPWTLSVVGDGQMRSVVQELFDDIPVERVTWHGLLESADIATLLAHSALYVWPGCGEAYGLAYLEAQAAGVPVVAYDTAGVPEVVKHETTGLLTPEGDDEAYAAAIASLLNNPRRLKTLAHTAAAHVQRYHSLGPASTVLHDIVKEYADIRK